ncbi:hypothetical protein L9F63_008670 [Diploptera punctata]|uniref:Translational activator of cytochrome c oxidase 1 n=1 Tax=Diploptera punctata TaxID=6984 RepID=A0AAD7Z4A5_DIPPU|nr:hypothetical protein L9F63_008670 [Diploptera punctata]
MYLAFRFVVRAKILCSDPIAHNLNISKRYAGHSKWANIKHIKAAKDAQKSTTFLRMSRLMRVAIQEGGGADPNFNVRLASLIEQARKYNMPLSNIKNVLEQSKASKGNPPKSTYYEIRGPGGCTVIASVLTDNLQKFKATIKTIVKKSNCMFAEGSVPALFQHKGLIVADPLNNTSLETAVEHAIEVGAEDVTAEEIENEQILQFVCDPAHLNQVKGKLMKLGYNIKNADAEFLPNNRISLSDDDLEAVQKLFDRLEDEPDVVKLHDNIL